MVGSGPQRRPILGLDAAQIPLGKPKAAALRRIEGRISIMVQGRKIDCRQSVEQPHIHPVGHYPQTVLAGLLDSLNSWHFRFAHKDKAAGVAVNLPQQLRQRGK